MFCEVFNSVRPGLFSHSPGQGGGRLRGQDAKNQGYHQPTEMKLCMSHYSLKNMPDAKFESDNFSIFGDMNVTKFLSGEGKGHRIRLFTPGK